MAHRGDVLVGKLRHRQHGSVSKAAPPSGECRFRLWEVFGFKLPNG